MSSTCERPRSDFETIDLHDYSKTSPGTSTMAASRRDSKFDNGRVVLQYIVDQPKTFYDEPSPTSSAFSVDIQDCKLPTSPPATLASPWKHSQTLDYFRDTNPNKADVLFDVEQGSPSTKTTRWPTPLQLSSGLGISSPISPRSTRKIQRSQSQSTKKPAPVTDFLSSFRPSRLAAALRSTVHKMYSGSPSKKSCPSTPLDSTPSYLNSESVLMLSLRASGGSEAKSNSVSSGDSPRLYAPQRSTMRSKMRTATLPIPATSSRRSKADHEKASWSRRIDTATSKTSLSPQSKTSSTSRRAPPPPFDDEIFFLQLRESYTHLRGGSLWRTCSARSLQRITVQGRGPQDFARPSRSSCDLYSCYSSSKLEILSPTIPTSSNGDIGSSSTSPTASTFPILSDDLSSSPATKDQTASTFLALFRDPALGRDHTTHVQWARRIANMPTLRIVPPHNDGCDPDPDDAAADADVEGRDRFTQEGLVFEIGFSWRRIFGATGVVLLAAILVGSAAGPGAVLGIGGGSVVSAVLLGSCVLLAGLAAVAVWLGVSWMML